MKLTFNEDDEKLKWWHLSKLLPVELFKRLEMFYFVQGTTLYIFTIAQLLYQKLFYD